MRGRGCPVSRPVGTVLPPPPEKWALRVSNPHPQPKDHRIRKAAETPCKQRAVRDPPRTATGPVPDRYPSNTPTTRAAPATTNLEEPPPEHQASKRVGQSRDCTVGPGLPRPPVNAIGESAGRRARSSRGTPARLRGRRIDESEPGYGRTPAMGWFVKGNRVVNVFFSFFRFPLLSVALQFGSPPLAERWHKRPGLTCYPYILRGVHYIVSNPARGAHRDQSLRRAIQRPRGSTRSPLRSRRFMRCGESRVNGAWPPPITGFATQARAILVFLIFVLPNIVPVVRLLIMKGAGIRNRSYSTHKDHQAACQPTKRAIPNA